MTRSVSPMTQVAWVIGLLAAGVAGGYWWAQRHAGPMAMSTPAPTASPDRKALYWYDPMVPDQHFDKPGKSPYMDMPLLPKYADDSAASGVRIAPGTQQNVGIRTAVVETGTLSAEIRAPATISWDLRQESVISARVDAIVSRVNVKAPYEAVRRGQPLASLLAPAWSSALAEAQALQQAESGSAQQLQAAAQQRLRVLGVSGRMARDGSVTLSAPRDGVVSEILVREGQTVMAGAPMFRVNGTSTLWLEAAIPQAGLSGVGRGTKVEATISALPGKTFPGEVETLLPQIDPVSRTQRARIVLRNPDGVLVPGMFAELTLRPDDGASVALVPTEALLATGADSRVIVVGDDGRFRPTGVRVGRSSGGRTEILAGLTGGERVVTSGQFLIDSEASLSGALQRLGAPGAAPSTQETSPDAEPRPPAAAPKSTAKSATASAQRDCPVLYWYDPMMPDKHFDQPGRSPFMDMQLVPKFGPDAAPSCTVRDVGTAAPKEPQR